MTRGKKRRTGAPSSGRGAAGLLDPPSTSFPTRPAAPPAETSKGRPGRPGRPGGNPLKKAARAAAKVELRTTSDIVARLEDVANRARLIAQSECGARDAAAALSVEARCVNKLYDIAIGSKLEAEIADLKAQVAQMNAHLAGKKGSAQRADVAPAPRLARRPESVQ